MFSRVAEGDAGKYTCRVSTVAGFYSIEVVTHLIVLSRELIDTTWAGERPEVTFQFHFTLKSACI